MHVCVQQCVFKFREIIYVYIYIYIYIYMYRVDNNDNNYMTGV